MMKRHFYITFLILVVLLIFFVIREVATEFKDEYKITSEIIKDGTSLSRLYKVTDKLENSFLISSDGELKKSSSYTIEEIHRNNFWNPVSCSRIPFVRLGDRFYFLEITMNKDEGELKANKTYMYVLDFNKKKLVKYDLDFNTTGYIYRDGSSLYVVSPQVENQVLKNLKVYIFDEVNSKFIKTKDIDVSKDTVKKPVYKKYKDNFALSYYNQKLDMVNLAYENGLLKETKLVVEEKVSFEGNLFKVYDKKNSPFLRKQSLHDFEFIQIIEKKTGEVLIELDDKGINKYIISEL